MPVKKKRRIITNSQANQGFMITGNNNDLTESSVTNNRLIITEASSLEGINQGYQIEGDDNCFLRAQAAGNTIEQIESEEQSEELSPVNPLLAKTSDSLPSAQIGDQALFRDQENEEQFHDQQKQNWKKMRSHSLLNELEITNLKGKVANLEGKVEVLHPLASQPQIIYSGTYAGLTSTHSNIGAVGEQSQGVIRTIETEYLTEQVPVNEWWNK